MTQRPFGCVVRRFDILGLQKRPQRVHAIKYMLAHPGLLTAQRQRPLFQRLEHRPPELTQIASQCPYSDGAIATASPVIKSFPETTPSCVCFADNTPSATMRRRSDDMPLMSQISTTKKRPVFFKLPSRGVNSYLRLRLTLPRR